MKRLALLLAIVSLLVAAGTAQIHYKTVECSNAPDFHVVFVLSINNNGAMVGAYYSDTDPNWHALLIKEGKCAPLAPETVLGTKASGAWSINENGDIVGAIFEGAALAPPSSGFLLKKDGVLNLFEFAAADATVAQGINQSGKIVGGWQIVDESGNLLSGQGFLLHDGEFVDIIVPGSGFTSAAGINASGDIVGYWGTGLVPFVENHGFLYSHGDYVTFDVPFSGATSTTAQAINDKGAIAGAYADGTSSRRGFLKVGSSFIRVDYPGALMTNINGINNRGQMVGWYFNPDFSLHAFVAELKK
jgi:uncharacterized membrane protein